MAIKRAVIHLGMPKAGSSSIQRTLYKHAAILEKNGFRYLTEWGEDHIEKFHGLFHRDVHHGQRCSNTFLPLAVRNMENKNSIKTMLRVINNSGCETLILSGEFFKSLYLDSTIGNIKNFIGKYFHSNNIETTIIYYIRNPLTWLISWMNQIFFSSGYLNKNADFFETAIKQYNGIFNLQEHFADYLKIIKFEEACLEKDGLVANFLTAINFPKDGMEKIDMSITKRNESRCMEVIEFVHFVEAMEDRHSFINYKRYIPSKFYRDIKPLKNIKGPKFDLPFQSKLDLWHRLQETVSRLKENLNIDYTDYKIPAETLAFQKTYSTETIQEFIEAFPKLNLIIQKHFLKFFEMKYMETAQEKFKQLHFMGSVPYTLYKRQYSFFGILNARMNNIVRTIKRVIEVKMPKFR